MITNITRFLTKSDCRNWLELVRTGRKLLWGSGGFISKYMFICNTSFSEVKAVHHTSYFNLSGKPMSKKQLPWGFWIY